MPFKLRYASSILAAKMHVQESNRIPITLQRWTLVDVYGSEVKIGAGSLLDYDLTDGDTVVISAPASLAAQRRLLTPISIVNAAVDAPPSSFTEYDDLKTEAYQRVEDDEAIPGLVHVRTAPCEATSVSLPVLIPCLSTHPRSI